MSYIGKIFVTVGILLGSFFGYHQPQNDLIGSSFNPVAGGTYRIQSSITSSQTTISLISFKEPVSGIPLTMSYANTAILYGTIEPQSNSKEFISFTGITQNADGSALLTGVTRGLGFSYPYTASTTLQQTHSGQSIFILSNPPQLTDMYANKSNDESISGQWTFSSAPIDSGTSTSTLQFATRGYANSLSYAGTATSSTLVAGIGFLATGAQAALGLHSANTPYFLSGQISTSTYFGDGSNNKIIVTKTNGTQANTIDPNFIATSSNYIWSGTNTFTSTATTTFTSPVALNATTTIVASKFIGGTTQALVAGETITGTTPKPVYIATSTGTVFMSDADVAVDKNFMGFAVSSSTTGGGIYVQTSGIVDGFTGLTAGLEYYVQDAVGTVGTSAGTAEIYVGQAVSTTQILIDSNRTRQYLGVTEALAIGGTVTASVPMYTRTIIGDVGTSNVDFVGADAYVLAIKGKLSAQIWNCDIGPGACSNSYSNSVTWTPGSGTGTVTLSGDAGGAANVYFYR